MQTMKQRILAMIQRLPEDVDLDRVFYHLGVMKGIDEALEQSRRGEVTDHDEIERRFLGDQWHESDSNGPPKRKVTSKGSERASHSTPRKRRKKSAAGSSPQPRP
jgi:hypothetical protein